MVNEWAIMKEGHVVNVITTVQSRQETQQQFPDYEIADIYSLPSHQQKQYEHWFDRP